MSKKTALSLYDQCTPAPDNLDISGSMDNERTIAEWWRKARLYQRAMTDLERVTMICHDPNEDKFYLASVPAES